MTRMTDSERSYSGTVVAAILLAVMVAAVGYRYWPSDERSIRRHLSNLAEALSFPLAESTEERLTRIAVLRVSTGNTQIKATAASTRAASRTPLGDFTGALTIVSALNCWAMAVSESVRESAAPTTKRTPRSAAAWSKLEA